MADETQAAAPAASEPQPESPKARKCNLPGCVLDAVTRGLCDAHWCTHRGLADVEVQDDGPAEVALP